MVPDGTKKIFNPRTLGLDSSWAAFMQGSFCGKMMISKYELAVINMEEIRTKEDLMGQIANMNKENSVCQIFIPGKGKFAIILQEEDKNSIAAEVRANPQLKQLMDESIAAYHEGKTRSTADLLKSLSPKDFKNDF